MDVNKTGDANHWKGVMRERYLAELCSSLHIPLQLFQSSIIIVKICTIQSPTAALERRSRYVTPDTWAIRAMQGLKGYQLLLHDLKYDVRVGGPPLLDIVNGRTKFAVKVAHP
jgi:hypothetical protein